MFTFLQTLSSSISDRKRQLGVIAKQFPTIRPFTRAEMHARPLSWRVNPFACARSRFVIYISGRVSRANLPHADDLTRETIRDARRYYAD